MSDIIRRDPNILVTGTPGVGKSQLSVTLAQRTGLEWIDVSALAMKNKCLEEFDQQYECHILDEEKLLDLMEDPISEGGKIVEYHSASLFPERWFDIVFVLRADNTILYDRLQARGYSETKLEDNIACEIFQTILEDAREFYKEDLVHELYSNTQEQMEENLDKICQWVEKWKLDNQDFLNS